MHHVDHAVNDDKRPGPPHPGAAERGKKKTDWLLTNTKTTPERFFFFVSRKHEVSAERFPLGDSSERVEKVDLWLQRGKREAVILQRTKEGKAGLLPEQRFLQSAGHTGHQYQTPVT